jgi:uncharacterized tellurite resistance protein B-like protein
LNQFLKENGMRLLSSFNEFAAFLFLHVASTDGSIHENETHQVQKKIARLFPEQDSNQVISKILGHYQEIKNEELGMFIRNSFHQFRDETFASKYNMFTDLYDIVNSDGKVDVAETAVLNQIRELIGTAEIEAH